MLVAEDDESIRLLLRHVLTDEGFSVREAADGIQAMSVLAEFTSPPTLVILDLAMPHMDGEAFASHLATRFDGRVPILILSAWTHEVLQAVGRRIGATAVLSKPFEVDELVRQVRELTKIGGSALETAPGE